MTTRRFRFPTAWWNYAAGRHVYLDGAPNETVGRSLVPQGEVAQLMYTICVKAGLTPEQAVYQVHMAVQRGTVERLTNGNSELQTTRSDETTASPV